MACRGDRRDSSGAEVGGLALIDRNFVLHIDAEPHEGSYTVYRGKTLATRSRSILTTTMTVEAICRFTVEGVDDPYRAGTIGDGGYDTLRTAAAELRPWSGSARQLYETLPQKPTCDLHRRRARRRLPGPRRIRDGPFRCLRCNEGR